MKLLFENWRKYLTEGKMKYSVSNTGYGNQYQFFDESGEQADQSLGMMVLDLVDAGVGGWAPEEQIDRMMAVNADPRKNQGGMQRWDSNVFEDYYDADTEKIIAMWAKMNGLEVEQVADPDAEEEYEDDGEFDFESTYSESRKRNKIHEGGAGLPRTGDRVTHDQEPERGQGRVVAHDHAAGVVLVMWDSGGQARHDPRVLTVARNPSMNELFGFGKKKMNPDGTECKACKDLKWAQNDVEVLGWQDRYAKSGQWFMKRREDPKFAEPRMPEDEHYMRGWQRGEQDSDDEAKYAHILNK